MVIRQLCSHDRDRIRRLLEQSGVFRKEEVQVAMDVLDETVGHPDKSDYHIFCADDGSAELVGYICFGPIPLTDSCYDLYWIAVDEKNQKRGVGGYLLRFAEEFVARNGGRRIYVDTSSTAAYEPARRFYLKHGYPAVCVLHDFYRKGDHRMICMKEMGPVAPKEIKT